MNDIVTIQKIRQQIKHNKEKDKYMNKGTVYTNINDAVFFYDKIHSSKPYVSVLPRNHETLFLVTEGCMLYEKDNIKEKIFKGQLGYIARGSIDKSSAYECPFVSYIAVNFNFDRENSHPTQTLPFNTVCSTGIMYKYEKMFNTALNEYISDFPGKYSVCSGLLLQIIGLLINEHETDLQTVKKLKKIEKAVTYLKEHYYNADFQINELSHMVNLSEKQFRRLFFDVFGKKPYAFLREYRLNKAEVLLQNTAKSVSAIALQCGFADVYSFSHCFKSHYGMSPQNYRMLHK